MAFPLIMRSPGLSVLVPFRNSIFLFHDIGNSRSCHLVSSCSQSLICDEVQRWALVEEEA